MPGKVQIIGGNINDSNEPPPAASSNLSYFMDRLVDLWKERYGTTQSLTLAYLLVMPGGAIGRYNGIWSL